MENEADGIQPDNLIGRVHDPHTGRLDAKLVAELFGVTLNELFSWIGISQNALDRSPTSDTVQPKLEQLVRSWEILRTVFADEQSINNWLNHRIGRLHGQTPLWLLRQADGIHSFEALTKEFIEPRTSVARQADC